MGARNNQMTRWAWARYGMAMLCLATVTTACSATQQVKVTQTDLKCGFLGSACDRLTPGAEGQAALRYLNPNANWTQYNKIILDPVTYWGSDTTKISAADQQTLVNYFDQVLHEDLGKKFQIVDQPGPGVMRLQVALTDAEAATPGLRSISIIIPQARTLNTLKYLATGTYAFIGAAQAEMKLIDSVSGQVLAEAVDRRVGGGAISAAAQWQWGDAENAMKAWATQLTDRLSTWTSGAVKPS
ncbi:MAG: DUF3313 domain-containing protein [Deltaproteobacteria bacterium]|nr:DUF3313 domain-containing protein [Deltaproteobacteria bacterium]